MAFGWPTRYLQLDMASVGGAENWDRAVHEANTEFKGRMVSTFHLLLPKVLSFILRLYLVN